MSSTLLIPPELTDAIIDNLSSDPQSLACCALASRTFIPRVRLHLFRDITLHHPRHASNTSSFLRLISDRIWIRPLVRSLTVHAESGFREDSEESVWEGDCSPMNEMIQTLLFKTAHNHQWICHDTSLPLLLASLPNLQSFSGSAFRWRVAALAPGCWECSIIQKPLRHLRLDYVEFAFIAALISVLRSFPHLKSLTLGVVLTASFPWVPVPEGPLLHLEELDVNFEGSARVVESLIASGAGVVDWGQLKRLRVRKCYRAQVELLRKMVDLLINLDELDVGECVMPDHQTQLDIARLKAITLTLNSEACVQWWVHALWNENKLPEEISLRVSSDGEKYFDLLKGALLSDQSKLPLLRLVCTRNGWSLSSLNSF